MFYRIRDIYFLSFLSNVMRGYIIICVKNCRLKGEMPILCWYNDKRPRLLFIF